MSNSPAPTPRRSRSTKASIPAKSTTGAVAQGAPVTEVICPAAPRRNLSGAPAVGHQTHGAVTSIRGPITSVQQLVNQGRSIAKGSSASFATLAEYRAHLNTLDLRELHRHAIEDAKQVPIDDRQRLIRRLETQWTATAARTGRVQIPARVPFTQEQIDAQNELKNRLLRQ